MVKHRISWLIVKAELIGKDMKYLLKKLNKDERGVIILEILIAMVIIILAISSVVMLVFGSQSSSVASQTNQEALYKAQLLIESARALAREDFYNPTLNAGTTVATENSGIIYTKNLIIEDIADYTKKITSLITWGTGQQVELTTVVTDWHSILGDDICSPNLIGDWGNPRKLGYADVISSGGATDIDISAKKAYVTTDPSPAGQEDFYIFNVSDPTLTPLPDYGSGSKLNTGPGLAAIHVAGNYAYVANRSTVSQLQIIDVATPSAPNRILSADLKVTAAGDVAVGNSVFYSNKRVYLGLTKSAGPEFYVIDVSNPLIPSVVGSFEIDTRVNAITVKNNVAYLATPWPDPSPLPRPATEENLSILDVSNPSVGISRLNTFTYPDPDFLSGESVYISSDGNTLYLGRGGLNSSHNPGFFMLNVTDPSVIPLPVINSKYIPTSNNVWVKAIAVRNNLAFLWTSDINEDFQIWDLNNLGAPAPAASLNTENAATGGLNCDGNFLYTAQEHNKALQIIGPGPVDPIINTTIYNDTGTPVTSVPSGTVIYDEATLSGSAGTPTGTVDFVLYTSKDNCTGTSNTETKNLFFGSVQSSTYTTSVKPISYKVHYNGDVYYNATYGACESLMVN